MNTILSVTFQ